MNSHSISGDKSRIDIIDDEITINEVDPGASQGSYSE